MCRPIVDFTCHLCNKPQLQATYAIDASNNKVCDKCTYRATVDNMKRAHNSGAKFGIYGPQKLTRGASVSNWPGAMLARVVSVGGVHHWTRRSAWGERYYCKLIDLHGNLWGGYIGEGLASTIKPISG
jgi:hypothetical protein